MFRGRYEHTVDDKGRLAIPARFRDELSRGDDPGALIVTNYDRCLVGYSYAEWERLEQRFVQLPQFDPRVAAFQRYFISGATECPIDKAGRILLPLNLRSIAQIQHECVITGALNKIEIWSQQRWVKEFDSIADQFIGLTEAMSSFGISL